MVPELQVPSVQPDATPTPQITPQDVGSAGKVGEGVEKIGDELFKVGYSEYERASQTFAQSKENDFQAKSQDLLDKYKLLQGVNAVNAHTKYIDDVAKLRESIGKEIPSKRGFDLYDNGSRRNERFAIAGANQHFETQSKQHDDQVDKTGLHYDTKAMVDLGSREAYDRQAVMQQLGVMHDRASARADRAGLEGVDREEFIKGRLGVGLDGLFDALAARHDPDLLKQEYAKFNGKGLLDKTQQIKATTQIYGSEAKQVAMDLVNAAPKSTIDADSLPDFADVRRGLQEMGAGWPAEKMSLALREVDQLEKDRRDSHAALMGQHLQSIIAVSTNNGTHAPHIDVAKSAASLGWVSRNDPTGNVIAKLWAQDASASARIDSAKHRADVASDRANLATINASLVKMASEDPAQFKDMNPVKLSAYLGGMALTADAEKKSYALLKTLQGHEAKSGGVAALNADVKALSSPFKNVPLQMVRFQEAATDYAINLMTRHPEMKRDQLRKSIEEFRAGDWKSYSVDTDPNAVRTRWDRVNADATRKARTAPKAATQPAPAAPAAPAAPERRTLKSGRVVERTGSGPNDWKVVSDAK